MAERKKSWGLRSEDLFERVDETMDPDSIGDIRTAPLCEQEGRKVRPKD